MTKVNFKEYSKPAKILIAMIGLIISHSIAAQSAGEGPRLSPRIEQEKLSSMSLREIRRAGLRIFSTPFNLADGLGDGPFDPFGDPTAIGNRPSLGGNGIFLRMHGLDSQTCLECHSILSNATIPSLFAVGGVGNISDSAFPGMVDPDIDDDGDNGSDALNGIASVSGRMINPPFSFGSGGVEMLAKEMTRDLQALRDYAELDGSGIPVPLVTKGVSFGSIIFQNGVPDTSGVEGVQPDLVIRPFGRKGCCFSIRDFDRGALRFHEGMQPVETLEPFRLGDRNEPGVDGDNDGVSNEILIGELSALHVFQVSLEKPIRSRDTHQSRKGEQLFNAIGCAGCHIPVLLTDSRDLPLAFPEIPEDPDANVFMRVRLSGQPAPGFKRTRTGGVEVALFADLKLHDMGPGLTENTGNPNDHLFTTARLWGIADTAPYLHDGRAVTINQAILLHGGEAQDARDGYAALSANQQENVLAFLNTLRTPRRPNIELQGRPRFLQ